MIIPTEYTVEDLSDPRMKDVVCSQVQERFLYLRTLKMQIESGQVDGVKEFGQDFVDDLLSTNFERGRMRFAIRQSGQVVFEVVPVDIDK